jgi:hypothetical protein
LKQGPKPANCTITARDIGRGSNPRRQSVGGGAKTRDVRPATWKQSGCDFCHYDREVGQLFTDASASASKARPRWRTPILASLTKALAPSVSFTVLRFRSKSLNPSSFSISETFRETVGSLR